MLHFCIFRLPPSRLSIRRTLQESFQSSTYPWTWWRSHMPKRPRRWSVIRTTGSPCISTLRCLMTWSCKRLRKHTRCRVRWEGHHAASFISFTVKNNTIVALFALFLSTLQKLYRSDLNYLRGAAWIATGALQIEGSKRATDLISEVRCPLPTVECWYSLYLDARSVFQLRKYGDTFSQLTENDACRRLTCSFRNRKNTVSSLTTSSTPLLPTLQTSSTPNTAPRSLMK